MARNLGLDEVVDHFTLIGDELELLRNKSGATRLGFAALLKYVLWRGRFPPGAHELPDDAVAHLARQVRVPAGELAAYDFASRTAQRHRTEIRAYTGFRECSVLDAEALTRWLAEHVASIERREPRVREELLARCRAQLIEPPTPDRVGEITRSALHRAEQALLGLIAARVDAATVERLEALIAVSDDDDDEGEDVLALIKAAPGNVSLDTMLTEIAKLEAIRAIGLPSDLFADVAPTVVAGLAGPRDGRVAQPSARAPASDEARAAVRAARPARAGGHRHARAAADLDDPPDQRARRAEGRRGVRQGLPPRPRQGHDAAQDRRSLPQDPRRQRS